MIKTSCFLGGSIKSRWGSMWIKGSHEPSTKETKSFRVSIPTWLVFLN